MSLPEFTRTIWASPLARETWEPRLQAVSRAWLAAELASVQAGLRAAALCTVAQDQLPEVAARAARVGLVAIPLEIQALGASYSNAIAQAQPGQPTGYRVAVVQPRAADQVVAAWLAPDRDLRIGQLLGFPLCCIEFFERVWNQGGFRDTTWHMDQTAGPPQANIWLRWLGVRLVPHLPCGHACVHTIQNAAGYAALLPESERRWAVEMLGWPMRWTALHGIAELETPCFKVNMSTDVDHVRRELVRQGTPPPEGASGVRFPYARPAQEALPLMQVRDARLWTDNGFTSQAAMEAAHARIADALRPLGPGPFLDLGCGNGLLLERLGRKGSVGVESDRDRAARGKKAGRDVRNVRIQELPDWGDNVFVAALISVRRLEEMTEADVARLRTWLAGRVGYVLLYSYDEPTFERVLSPLALEAVHA